MNQSTENDFIDEEPDLLTAISEGLGYRHTTTSTTVTGHALKGLFELLVKKGVLSKDEISAMLDERQQMVEAITNEYEPDPSVNIDPAELNRVVEENLAETRERFDEFRSDLEGF